MTTHPRVQYKNNKSPMVTIKPRSNRGTPNIVLAPAPWDKLEFIELYCHPQTIQNMIDDAWNAKIGEYCGLIHGNIVELRKEWVSEGGTFGLVDSIALFQGLNRPMKQPGIDKEIYTYVTNPPRSYAYPQNTRYAQVGRQLGVTPVSRPNDAVFATYVDFTDNFAQHGIDNDMLSRGTQIKGVVLFWEWVRNSAQSPNLPDDYESRYVRRVW